MKKYFFLTFLLVTFILQAQDQKERPKIEDMHARKWQYIVDQANLTPQEAAKVQPIFMEYEQAVWKLMEKNRPFFVGNKNPDDNDKPNFEEMNERFINTEIQKAQLLKTYYQNLKKVLSAEKIFNIGAAERSFRKELVKNWQGKRRPINNN
jgi:hypothetical protein